MKTSHGSGHFASLRDLPPLQPGTLRLYDNLLPKLPAGTSYSIKVTQVVQFPQYDKPKPPVEESTFTNSLPFEVEAPQFVLNGPQQVFSVSPAAGHAGNFSSQLPHIVFTDPYLPWTRGIVPESDNDPGVPWLALLLFDEADFTAPAALPTVASLPIAEILTPSSATVYRPNLGNVSSADAGNTQLRIDAIDIPTSLFLALVPRLEELALLAHVREVNPESQEQKLLYGNGRYSTVIGNRFPAASDSGTLNGCYLVSLEGFAPNLSSCSGSPTPTPITQATVRLVVLASWTFRAIARDAGFAARMSGLSVGTFGLVQPPQQHSHAPVDIRPDVMLDVTPDVYAKQALTNGYVPLNHDPNWLGEQTPAWYRGPLAPCVVDEVGPLHFANPEAAMIYDKNFGVFDLSYAVAWQAGRLLALSSRAFASNLLGARQQGIKVVQDAARRAGLRERVDTRPEAELITELARPQLVKELAHRFAAELLADGRKLVPARLDPKRPRGPQGGHLSMEALIEALRLGLDPVLTRSSTP